LEHLVTGRLAGKVAVVTGASRGIGAAACVALAREGASVVVNTYPDERMDALADEVVSGITGAGGAAVKVRGDVTVPADVERLVEVANREFGDVDVMVANAAYSKRREWYDIDVEQWDHTMAVNARGTFLCAKAAYPGMLRRGGGSIITVSSVMVELGMVGCLDYVASKGAIIGLTRALARDVGKHGIRVNSVMPGAIRTENELELGGDEATLARDLAAKQSLPRRGYAVDLAQTFVFLASDDSSFITGQIITVDGGWINR
jgi:3-oxoacyl-[acyl-carrier protein] reductase